MGAIPTPLCGDVLYPDTSSRNTSTHLYVLLCVKYRHIRYFNILLNRSTTAALFSLNVT